MQNEDSDERFKPEDATWFLYQKLSSTNLLRRCSFMSQISHNHDFYDYVELPQDIYVLYSLREGTKIFIKLFAPGRPSRV